MASVNETSLERSGNAEGIDQKQNIRRRYTFHIGASWAAKPDALCRSPHPSDTVLGSWRDHMLSITQKSVGSSSQKGDAGEDFFFVQQMRNQSGISLGVADGVGSWAEVGVDPSLFPQALMYYAHQSLGEPESDPAKGNEERSEQIVGQEMTPYKCLELAYSGVLQDEQVEAGSSTACIISLDASSGVLRSANLGDSGYSIIRSNSIFYTSSPQTHCFNGPKQLAKPPNSSSYFSDPPSTADTHKVKLRDGDIIIVYTDGLTDNAFPYEILKEVCSRAAQAGETEDEQVQSMADHMVKYAQQCMGFGSWKESPFKREARMAGIWNPGAKTDDVTVIVVRVRKTSS